MSIDPFVDTLMNVTVFVFIGLMVWLYFKEMPVEDEGTRDREPGAPGED